jgi:hypothetical protein
MMVTTSRISRFRYVSGGCTIAYLSIRFFEAYFIQLMFCLCGLGCIFVAILEYVVVQWNLAGFVFTFCFGIALNSLALALLLLRIKVEVACIVHTIIRT